MALSGNSSCCCFFFFYLKFLVVVFGLKVNLGANILGKTVRSNQSKFRVEQLKFKQVDRIVLAFTKPCKRMLYFSVTLHQLIF